MLIDLISNYGLFLLKTLTVLISILLILSFAVNSKKSKSDGSLEVTNINNELVTLEENIKKNILTSKEFKKFIKHRKKNLKNIRKNWKTFALGPSPALNPLDVTPNAEKARFQKPSKEVGKLRRSAIWIDNRSRIIIQEKLHENDRSGISQNHLLRTGSSGW